ncbi:hypothetical protein LCM19_13035 [Qipengyuania flava]|nr:hypothetical protein [Qipengyuania flava]
MMRFNPDSVLKLVEDAYVLKVIQAFGSDGSSSLSKLLDAVKLLYRDIAPEGISASLTMVSRVTEVEGHEVEGLEVLTDIRLVAERMACTSRHVLVTLEPNGRFGFLATADISDAALFTGHAIVYRFQDHDDRIMAGDHDEIVPKVSSVQCSMFAVPTLSGLEDALRQYALAARETRCRILDKVWVGGGDGPRLVLANKPERIMRDSLEQALSTLLQANANVRPEQNTDERKPVDLRIEWYGSRASALIEIKWIGRAVAKSRSESEEDSYTEYSDGRARDGAKQLADYLDREKRRSKDTTLKGYLVVFDARRKNVAGPEDRLSKTDALHFEEREINYDPKLEESRDDFAPPQRFFMTPRESDFRIAA